MPPKHPVKVSKRLERDLEEIQDFIATDSPQRAMEFSREVVGRVLSLGTMALRAPLVPEKGLARQGYRHLVFGDYRIIFRVDEKAVWVLRAIHGARQLKKGMS